MARHVKLYYVFLLVFNFSLVLCSDDYIKRFGQYYGDNYSPSRNNDYDQIINGYNGNEIPEYFPILFLVIAVVSGVLIFVGLIICCIAICCPCSCCRKERRGYIISLNIPHQQTASLIEPQILQAATVQHFPPETEPYLYDSQPLQQQSKSSSTENLLQRNAEDIL